MRVTVIATGFIADNSDTKKPEPVRAAHTPVVETPVAPQPAPAPVAPSVDDIFRKLESEPIPEAPKPVVEPASNASYDSIYGGTYKCIVKNKRR
jgi:hypothetical protein